MRYLNLKIAAMLSAAVASMIGASIQASAEITNNSSSTSTNQNTTGSILLVKTIGEAIVSQIKTSMGNATAIAEHTIGPNSHAVLATLDTERGSLVYTVWVADSGFNFNRVQIDPANGKVLSSQPLTLAMRQQTLLEMQRGIMMMGPGGTGTTIGSGFTRNINP